MPTSSIRFVYEWQQLTRPDGSVVFRPVLPVLVSGSLGFLPRYFLVDSGADFSMAPLVLCRQLGLHWQDGAPITLRGISQRKACMVQGRIHEVELLVPDAGVTLRLPMVFARGNTPFLLGRESAVERGRCVNRLRIADCGLRIESIHLRHQ